MSGRIIAIKGYRIDKAGRLVRDQRRLPANLRLKQVNSRRVRAVRRISRD